jgi:hypothetical protein
MKKITLISLVVTLLGVTGLGAGFYYKHKLNEAQKGLENLFSHDKSNPFSDAVGFGAKSKLKSYELKIHLLLAISAIMTAGGASLFVYFRQKNS